MPFTCCEEACWWHVCMPDVWSSWASSTLLAPTVMGPLSHLVKSLSFHSLPVTRESLLLFISTIVFFFVIHFPTLFPPMSFFYSFLISGQKNTNFHRFMVFLNRCDKCCKRWLMGVPSPWLIFHLIDYNEQPPITTTNTHTHSCERKSDAVVR